MTDDGVSALLYSLLRNVGQQEEEGAVANMKDLHQELHSFYQLERAVKEGGWPVYRRFFCDLFLSCL